MLKRFGFVFGLVAFLLVSSTALAQGPQPQHADPNWLASYWNNKYLRGDPVLQRSEASIDHDWGHAAPVPGVENDAFSARWTRYIEVAPGTYRFTATYDDGMRIYVDDNLILDEWRDHPATTRVVEAYLGSGHHRVMVEYYENAYDAIARLSITPNIPADITHWRGAYYNNTSLSGEPVLVRDDSSINFNWGLGSPAQGIVNADNFSARWTRKLNLPAGMYRFTMSMDDGCRLWVNGHLLLDDWVDQSPNTHNADIYLPGGDVPVQFDYYERGGIAIATLDWALLNAPQPQPQTVLVDDGDAAFMRGGTSRNWRAASNGWGGDLLWTFNNDRVRTGYNWARWYPSLSASSYEVFAHIPAQSGMTTQARYWVAHADGTTLQVVDQNSAVARWASLGVYRFTGTRGDWVSLADITYERYLSHRVVWDAMKWEPC